LTQIAPWHVGQYFAQLAKTTSIATRNQHLSALRHFFDGLVTRHAIVLNPALSVRGERYSVMEGKTPEIPKLDARKLLASMDTSHVVGLRDRAMLAALIYTGARAGAVAKLKRGDFYHAGGQWMLHFDEKGGKSREIPVRHDLEGWIFEYMDAAGLRDAPMCGILAGIGETRVATAGKEARIVVEPAQSHKHALMPCSRSFFETSLSINSAGSCSTLVSAIAEAHPCSPLHSSPANAFDSTEGSKASSSVAVSACKALTRSVSAWMVFKSATMRRCSAIDGNGRERARIFVRFKPGFPWPYFCPSS
jgi:hypothetical protein